MFHVQETQIGHPWTAAKRQRAGAMGYKINKMKRGEKTPSGKKKTKDINRVNTSLSAACGAFAEVRRTAVRLRSVHMKNLKRHDTKRLTQVPLLLLYSYS